MAKKATAEKPAHSFGLASFSIRIVFLIVILSMLAAYISNRVEINSRRQELASLKTQLDQQNEENTELSHVLDGDDDEILEHIARDTYGYAAPNERVFIDMSGK